MATEGKDVPHEDVFDSLQGASSLTLLKKISLAAVAIAIVAFFLFWSHSPSTDEKTVSQDTSGPVLRDRIVTLEEEVRKLKDDLKKALPAQFGSTQELAKQDTVSTTETAQIASTTSTESINLKSLFEEELQTATASKETAVADHETTDVKETSHKSTSKVASKTQPKQEKSSSKSSTYVVKKGDTLSKIAQRFYGSPLKWKRIVEANKSILGDNNVLKVGMKLTIPQE